MAEIKEPMKNTRRRKSQFDDADISLFMDYEENYEGRTPEDKEASHNLDQQSVEDLSGEIQQILELSKKVKEPTVEQSWRNGLWCGVIITSGVFSLAAVTFYFVWSIVCD
jgi:hypothetical protein